MGLQIFTIKEASLLHAPQFFFYRTQSILTSPHISHIVTTVGILHCMAHDLRTQPNLHQLP
jgi:hypothetical protein